MATEIEMVQPGRFLDLGEVVIDAGRVVMVRWIDRTEMGTYGNHVIARTARVVLALPGGGAGHAEVKEPRNVKRLQDWLRLWTCYETRAA